MRNKDLNPQHYHCMQSFDYHQSLLIESQNSTMRKAIAKRLSDSKFSAPHYYLNIECEMDNMISFRKQFVNTQNIKTELEKADIRPK